MAETRELTAATWAPQAARERQHQAEGDLRKQLAGTRKCCANCLYATRPGGRWLQLILSRFAGLLLCANCAEAPGELRGVVPGGVCPNFRRRRPPAVRSAPPGPSDGRVFFIPLTQGQYAIVDAEDYDRVSRFKWCLSRSGHRVYAQRRTRGKTIRMHQFIMNPPPGMVVDHIDGNGLNNRRGNLRICTRMQNTWNNVRHKGPDAASQYTGVHRYKKRPSKWYIKVQCAGVATTHGPFDSELAAARARDYRAVELHGPYAHVNLPDEWPPERREAVMAAARRRALAPKDAALQVP